MVASRDTTKNSVLFLAGLIAMAGLLQPALLSSPSLLALAHPTASASASYGSFEGLVRRNGPEDPGYISVQRRDDSSPDSQSTDATPSDSGNTDSTTPNPSDTTSTTPPSTPSTPDGSNSNGYSSTDTKDILNDVKSTHDQVKAQIKGKVKNIINEVKEGTPESKDQAKNEAKEVAGIIEDSSQGVYDKYKGELQDNSDIKSKVGEYVDSVKSKLPTQGTDSNGGYTNA